MQIFLVGTFTAAILFVLLIIGSGVRRGIDNIPPPARATIVHKNQTSPTLEELAHKAGDPAQAVAPKMEREFGSPRTEERI